MRRAFAKLRDLSFDKGTVTMHWEGDRSSSVPLVWLRDNPQSGPRGKLATSMKIQAVTLDEKKDTLTIKWLDRAPDSYTGEWLAQQLLPTPPCRVPTEPLTTSAIAIRLSHDSLASSEGKKTLLESILRSGVAVIDAPSLNDCLKRVFDCPLREVPTKCGELHTEGAFLCEVPKLVAFSSRKSMKLRLLDSCYLRSDASLAAVLPAFASVKASYAHWTASHCFRAEHSLLTPEKVVYSEQWRDRSVREREFYAALGHFHQFLSQEQSTLQTEIPPNSAVLIDNFRVLHDRSEELAEVFGVLRSDFQAVTAGLGGS